MPPKISKSGITAVNDLLHFLVASAGLQLEFTVTGSLDGSSSGALSGTDSAPRKDRIKVEFTGPDTPLLTARNGELLNAMEHIAAKTLRLEEQDHDRIVFDADSFKANRDRELQRLADTAIESVRGTGRPYAFRPMTSHERRLLHLLLAESGLKTSSSGETPRRFVMLFPDGYDPEANQSVSAGAKAVPVSDRVHAIRNSFRRR